MLVVNGTVHVFLQDKIYIYYNKDKVTGQRCYACSKMPRDIRQCHGSLLAPVLLVFAQSDPAR